MKLNARLYGGTVLVLLIVFTLLLVSVALETSPVWDEPNGIALGHYFLTTRDYTLNLGHPPLAFMFSGFPLLFTGAELPEDAASYSGETYNAYSNAFFAQFDNIETIMLLGRLSSILFAIGTAIVVLIWSRLLYGRAASLLALSIYVFNAAVIGNMATALNDVAVTFFITLTMFLFWLSLTHRLKLLYVLVALSFSLALLSKMTALFMLPMLLLVYVMHKRLYRAPQNGWTVQYIKRHASPLFAFSALLAVCIFITSFVVFAFQIGSVYDALPPNQQQDVMGYLSAVPLPLKNVSLFVLTIPLPFPSLFVAFMQSVGLATIAPKNAYLLGQVYEGGTPVYFFVEFVLKNSLVFLMLLAAAIVSVRKRFTTQEWFVILPPLIYFTLFLPLNENLCIRHLMPLYGFLAIFMSRVVKLDLIKRKTAILLLGAGLIIYAGGIAAIHPYEFSFFNELVGADDGHHYLVDGNLDSGQALPALRNYLHSQGIESIPLSYFGSVDPAYYGINYTYLPSPRFQAWTPDTTLFGENTSPPVCEAKQGIIAVSATNVHNVYLPADCYTWLHDYTPSEKLGHSIFIYNVSAPARELP